VQAEKDCGTAYDEVGGHNARQGGYRMELRHDMLNHGVNVVTAQHEGRRGGLAVAWATQIATDRLLICVGSQSTTRTLILGSKAFAVNVLLRDQLDVARRFGGRHSAEIDKFEGLSWHTGGTGAPLLDDCATVLECRVERVFDEDGERLMLGRVVAAEHHQRDYEPLIYRESDY
jgi:3-hydroxy-9,10-secoandrosta-1,3,5(10)-triene-9,17-dione monooxygenase reductase component